MSLLICIPEVTSVHSMRSADFFMDYALLRLVRVGWVLEQKPHGCAAVSILLRGGHESSGTLVGRRSAGHQ